MFPSELPWISTETGAQVALGQLGLLIVRKVRIDFAVVVLGKGLRERSITIDDGKARAEAAARRWVGDAAKILWSKEEPRVAMPTRTIVRPGGLAKD